MGMTKHEAVEILEEVKTLDDSMFAYSQAYNDALEMAIEALKTQDPVEPKPPFVKENSYGWKFYYCPSCGKEFYQNNKFNFCEKCGQAVKWE